MGRTGPKISSAHHAHTVIDVKQQCRRHLPIGAPDCVG